MSATNSQTAALRRSGGVGADCAIATAASVYTPLTATGSTPMTEHSGLNALAAVAQPADHERQAEHQQDVAEDRPDDRCLDHLGQPGPQREDADEQLGQVSQRTLHDAGRAGAQPVGDLFHASADQSGERCQRQPGDDERRGRIVMAEVQPGGDVRG